MTILPGFGAWAWPGLKYLNIFWAKKLVLVRFHQLLPRNVTINKILQDWSDESVKNDHFTRILGSGAARPEIFECILGCKLDTGNYPTDFAQKHGKKTFFHCIFGSINLHLIFGRPG
jgi:hypothetical protein